MIHIRSTCPGGRRCLWSCADTTLGLRVDGLSSWRYSYFNYCLFGLATQLPRCSLSRILYVRVRLHVLLSRPNANNIWHTARRHSPALVYRAGFAIGLFIAWLLGRLKQTASCYFLHDDAGRDHQVRCVSLLLCFKKPKGPS